MSFIGCTFDYPQCTRADADFLLDWGTGAITCGPVCRECLAGALETLRADEVKVTWIGG